MSSTSILALEIAYDRLAPMLFGALGRLARSGFITAPADAQDLIHDFFLEVWPGLTERYRPELGPLEAYVYKAFVQFARPRIVRLIRLQRDLSDPVLLDGLRSGGPAPDEDTENQRLTKALAEGIAALPEDLRQILEAYCYAGTSERELARTLHLSRYKLRDHLIEALGRVVVLLPKPAGIAALDWDVARGVWTEQRSLAEVARILHITEHQAHVAYRNCIAVLTNVIKQYKQPKRNHHMTAQLDNPVELLRAALLSPGNEALLQKVRDHASEIVARLNRDDSAQEPLAAAAFADIESGWAARVYEALAGPAAEALAETDDIKALFQAREEDLAGVGAAFEQVLIQNLPDELRAFPHCFSEVLPVAPEIRERLLRQPDVQAYQSAIGIATFGITPVTVLTATNAVARLADRMLDRGLLSRGSPLLLSIEDAETIEDRQQFDYSLVANEVERSTTLAEPAADALLRWCIGVAQYKPLLFDGFDSEAESRFGITMTYTGQQELNLFQRWAPSGRPAAQPHSREVGVRGAV